MIPVNLRLPPKSEVYNFLYRSTDPAYRTQDVLTVRLANGIYIDVGWYPEHDPNGAYELQIFVESPNHLLGQPLLIKDIDQLIQTVEYLSAHYSRTIAAASSSSNSSDDVRLALVA